MAPVPCRAQRCRARIVFALPEPPAPQNSHPVDWDSADQPGPQAGLEVWRDEHGVLRYRVLKRGERPAPGRHLGTSHYATCSDPAAFRRRS